MAGANPLGPDEEWTCPCGGWDETCDHGDDSLEYAEDIAALETAYDQYL